MADLSAAELDAAPGYLKSQLGLSLDKLNECVAKLNDAVTDKRFLNSSDDCLTADEFGPLLRLGSRTKTLVLLLIHCGKLKSLDSGRGGSDAASARYRITK